MRPLPRTAEQSEENTERKARVRRRCAGGAIAAGAAYLAVLTTAAARPTALHQPVAFGLLVGFGTVAALCGLAAILSWASAQYAKYGAAPVRYEVDDIDWAIQFGAEMAEAFPDRELGNTTPRGPSIR